MREMPRTLQPDLSTGYAHSESVVGGHSHRRVIETVHLGNLIGVKCIRVSDLLNTGLPYFLWSVETELGP